MDDLIYNQTRIPKEKWRYGFRSSAKVGCGWIATYNALRLMGYAVDIRTLIRSFERQLPLINGNTGTFFLGPALLLKKWGFPIRVAFRKKKFDALCRESDVCILFYYWHHRFRIGSHFVALRNSRYGILGYNTYSNSAGPDAYGNDLAAFLRAKKMRFPVLVGIRKK